MKLKEEEPITAIVASISKIGRFEAEATRTSRVISSTLYLLEGNKQDVILKKKVDKKQIMQTFPKIIDTECLTMNGPADGPARTRDIEVTRNY